MRFAEERSSKLLRAVDASGLNLKMTTNVDFIRDLDILCFLILFFCTLSAIQTIYERKIAFKTQSKYWESDSVEISPKITFSISLFFRHKYFPCEYVYLH